MSKFLELLKKTVDNIWKKVRPVLPDKVKLLVVKLLTKNQKLLVVLDRALELVKAITLLYGSPAVVTKASLLLAIDRMLELWGLKDKPLPETVTLVKETEAESKEVINVAMRDFTKFVLENHPITSEDVKDLSGNEKNLLVEMAYDLVKDEIASNKLYSNQEEQV